MGLGSLLCGTKAVRSSLLLAPLLEPLVAVGIRINGIVAVGIRINGWYINSR